MRLALGIGLIVLVCAPSAALAEGFGKKGTIVPHGKLIVGAGWTPGSGSGALSVVFDPTVDFFVLDNLSLGISMHVGGSLYSGYRAHSFGMGGGAGYFVPLSQRAGVFPKVGVLLLRHGATGLRTTVRSLHLTAHAPLLFHQDHFFLGVGPSLERIQWDGDAAPQWSTGVSTVIGGWF